MTNKNLIIQHLEMINQLEERVLELIGDINNCLKTINQYKAKIKKELDKDEVRSRDDM